MARHSTAQPVIGGLRALVIAGAATLVASVLVIMVSRGHPGGGSDSADLAMLPIVPVATPPGGADPAGPPTPPASSSSSAAPSASTSSVAVPPSRPPRATATPRPGFAAQHEARLRWRDTQLSRVTVHNTGTGAGSWTVALVFADGVRVDRQWVVSGGTATFAQDGSTARFTGTLGAGATIVVEYQVRTFGADSALPRSCTVNGARCG